MDSDFYTKLRTNTLVYKTSLDRIIQKYAMLQDQDEGEEVDLNVTNARTLERYMNESRTKLNKLESKSQTDLREDNIQRYSQQLDLMHDDSEAAETSVSSGPSTQISTEEYNSLRSETTDLTESSMDESLTGFSEMAFQPEDQDEELEMSLRSNGDSLVSLYPSMISRIEKAMLRKHVSEAAESVLRRYRRWRQQPSRSNLNNTFTVTQRYGKPKKMTHKTLLKEISNSPGNKMGNNATTWSTLQSMSNLQDLEAHQRSPGGVRGLPSREQQKPILVMDFDSAEISNPKEILPNETFNVSQLEEPYTYVVSPSQPAYPTAKASLDLSLRSKRLFYRAPSLQTDGPSFYASQTTAVKERPDIYSSPVGQNPSARMMRSLSRSPRAFSRSPKVCSMEIFSRNPTSPRSMPCSPSPSPQRPIVPPRMLDRSRIDHSFQSQLRSPQKATAPEGGHRLRRHLSFDSALPVNNASYSPHEVDENFIKLYHKFFCENKSSLLNRPPCRFCARNSEASRGHSSSALAALALSPHRSLLRKRHRELSLDSQHQSKRSKREYCASSPGSKRYGNELLRRRLCLSESKQSCSGLSHSPSKHALQRFSAQQHPEDAHQESWMGRSFDTSAAECSGLGGSFESKMANRHSLRKWY